MDRREDVAMNSGGGGMNSGGGGGGGARGVIMHQFPACFPKVCGCVGVWVCA